MSPETSLILLEKPLAALGKPGKNDHKIWLMKRRGWTDEQLAGRFNTKETTIKLAIDRYQLHRDLANNDEIDFEVNKMTSRLLAPAEKVIVGAMNAEMTISVKRGRSVISKKVADYATRLKGVEMLVTLKESTRPKGGGINVNTQINNGKEAAPQNGGRGFDFEARLRTIRESKGMIDEEKIPDAEYEDEDVAAPEFDEEIDDGEDDDE